MGCMSSKVLRAPEPVREAPEISWPTKCYRNPGVLPSTLAIGYPYPYPDGYPNTPPPFPIPTTAAAAAITTTDSCMVGLNPYVHAARGGLIFCDNVHGFRPRRFSSMEKHL